MKRCASNDPRPFLCILCISLFVVSVPSAVGFRTLLTFDSPLPGIKYSWATAQNAASSPEPSRDFESFIALARPAKHFWALRFESESRDECSGIAVELCCFPRETGTFAIYYVFGAASVSAQLSRNCQQTLASLSISRQSHPIESRRFASKKIHTEIDSFELAKGNDVINILYIRGNYWHNIREKIFSLSWHDFACKLRWIFLRGILAEGFSKHDAKMKPEAASCSYKTHGIFELV